ncbi:hypothetical protein XENOCAPTIV_019324 [Xenoophorus captivus]|uniref:Uncharacterized protein n=1 Tax=Xenoophorus captivus TaxID=1517983 RepID=A0ABV0S7S0_9TELE
MITLWEYHRRAAEKISGQAREKEEQRLPSWGSRLAIPPPGTGPRHHRPCAAETGFIQARREEEQRSPFWGTRLAIPLPDTVPPVVQIRTGTSTSFPEGLAHTPSSCLASSTLLPGSQPCSSDHPVPPSGSWRKNMATHFYSLKL